MIKKINFAALVMAAGLMTVSCSNDNDEVKAPQSETSFKVSIKAAPSTRAAAGTEIGVGDENKINDGWFVIAKESLSGKYKAFPSAEVGGATADGNGLNDVAEVRGVAANAEFYVIANAPAGLINTVDGYDTAAEVIALTTRLTKASINTMTTALQTNQTAPNFGTERIIFSGKATSPGDQPAGSQPAAVSVPLERNMSKVALTIKKDPSAIPVVPGFDTAEFLSVESISIRKVKPGVVPFNDNWVAIGDFEGDENSVDFTPNDGLVGGNDASIGYTGYRFDYTLQTNWVKGTTDGKSFFYVTPSLADNATHTTLALVHAKVLADLTDDGIANPTVNDRVYKIRIADPDETGENNRTIRNGSYKINATFASFGYSDEEEAVNGKVDMDVEVTLANWSIREYNVEI